MKKIALILAVIAIGCTKQDTPEPAVVIAASSPVTQTTQSSVVQQYNFNGVWSCDDWIVDDMSGATRKRSFVFSNQTAVNVNVSLNQYSSSGVMTQLYTLSTANVDSNYFDNPTNTIPVHFKGVMTTDSTLMVYEYGIDVFNALDTIQIKEFKRN